MASASPSELLDRLDKIFAETVLDAKSRDLTSEPDYMEQHEQFRTKANAELLEKNICTIAEVMCEVLQASSSPFRLCSIGCGSGGFDKRVLEKALQKFPETKFQYVGIDVNEVSRQEARECFESMANVAAEVRADDIQELNMAEFEPFDLIVCVNTLYYMTSLETALSNCLKMLKEKGKFIIINAGNMAWSNLYGRFWFHQNKTPMMFSPAIKQALKKMNVAISQESTNKGMMDLTQYFKDNFELPYQKCILNFLAHCNLETYPPAVTQLAKDYLWSIAEGTPEKALVCNSNDIMIIG